MNTNFTFGPSPVAGDTRIALTFECREFFARIRHRLLGIQRASVRDGGFVLFPAEIRETVESVVRALCDEHSPAAIAAREAVAAAARAAADAAVEKKRRAAERAAAKALADFSDTVRITRATYNVELRCGYAAGIPAMMRELGGDWDKTKMAWLFPNSDRVAEQLESLRGEICKKLAAQKKRDARGAATPARAAREMETWELEAEVWDLGNMTGAAASELAFRQNRGIR